MKFWKISIRGIFGFLFSLIIGLFHIIYELATNENEHGWNILDFEFNNPLWFLAFWATIGCIFFLWGGWGCGWGWGWVRMG